MNANRPLEPSSDRIGNPDDEIGIFTLIKFFWKWKLLILSVTLFCALAGVVVSLFMTKIYRIDILMEEVVVGIKSNGERIYLGSGPSIKRAIESGRFNNEILTSLKEESKAVLPRKLSFKVSLESSNHLIRVAYETASVKLGTGILSKLLNLLQKWFLGPIESWRKSVDKKIVNKQIEMGKLERGMGAINKKIKLVKLMQEQVRLEEKRERLREKREKERERLREKRERLREKREKERERSEKEAALFRSNAEIASGKDYIKYVRPKLDGINSDIEANQNYIAFLIRHNKQMLSQKGEDKYSHSKGNSSDAIVQGFEVLDIAKDSADTLHEKMESRLLEIQLFGYQTKRLRKEIEQLSAEIVRLGTPESVGKEEGIIVPSVRESTEKEIEGDLQPAWNDKSDEIRRMKAQMAIDNLQGQRSDEENKIRAKREEINNFEADKKNIKNVQVLQSPTVNKVPIRPRKERIVGIATVAGFFLSLFLAISLEYTSKYRRRECD